MTERLEVISTERINCTKGDKDSVINTWNNGETDVLCSAYGVIDAYASQVMKGVTQYCHGCKAIFSGNKECPYKK